MWLTDVFEESQVNHSSDSIFSSAATFFFNSLVHSSWIDPTTFARSISTWSSSTRLSMSSMVLSSFNALVDSSSPFEIRL